MHCFLWVGVFTQQIYYVIVIEIRMLLFVYLNLKHERRICDEIQIYTNKTHPFFEFIDDLAAAVHDGCGCCMH